MTPDGPYDDLPEELRELAASLCAEQLDVLRSMYRQAKLEQQAHEYATCPQRRRFDGDVVYIGSDRLASGTAIHQALEGLRKDEVLRHLEPKVRAEPTPALLAQCGAKPNRAQRRANARKRRSK